MTPHQNDTGHQVVTLVAGAIRKDTTMHQHYGRPNPRNETPDQRRRRWAREESAFNARQRRREQEKAEEEEDLHRRMREDWERTWAAMSPEERTAHATRETEIEAERVARVADEEEHRRWREAQRTDPFSTFGT